ncbi:ROK family protein, partial [Aeromonas jandaei]|uniref:ROK family protein n=1 Tax=Aeromonas jandaei TaxID=650 RepID=UPI0038B5DB6C
TAKVKSKAKEKTDIVIGQLFKVIDKLISEIPSDKKLEGIGIGVAGLIDKRTSIVRRSVNINLNDVNLKEVVEDKYKV